MKFRIATAADLDAIVHLLNDDMLGQTREDPEQMPAYEKAFKAISKDPGNDIIVGDADGEIVAVCQLSVIPNLTFAGATRGQIEGVRVARAHLDTGIGEQLVEHVIDMAKASGCKIIQLTTNKARKDALRFYEKLGFEATHEGLKLYL